MPASKAQRAQTADRRAKAVALKIAGLGWQAIADQLDYSDRGAACKDVTRALEASLAEESEQVALLRHVTVQRYDRLQAAWWPKALQGDVKAAEIILKILAGRAKVEGTDAPIRAELSGPGGGPIALTTAEMDEFETLLTAGDVPTASPDRQDAGDDGD